MTDCSGVIHHLRSFRLGAQSSARRDLVELSVLRVRGARGLRALPEKRPAPVSQQFQGGLDRRGQLSTGLSDSGCTPSSQALVVLFASVHFARGLAKSVCGNLR